MTSGQRGSRDTRPGAGLLLLRFKPWHTSSRGWALSPAGPVILRSPSQQPFSSLHWGPSRHWHGSGGGRRDLDVLLRAASPLPWLPPLPRLLPASRCPSPPLCAALGALSLPGHSGTASAPPCPASHQEAPWDAPPSAGMRIPCRSVAARGPPPPNSPCQPPAVPLRAPTRPCLSLLHPAAPLSLCHQALLCCHPPPPRKLAPCWSGWLASLGPHLHSRKEPLLQPGAQSKASTGSSHRGNGCPKDKGEVRWGAGGLGLCPEHLGPPRRLLNLNQDPVSSSVKWA